MSPLYHSHIFSLDESAYITSILFTQHITFGHLICISLPTRQQLSGAFANNFVLSFTHSISLDSAIFTGRSSRPPHTTFSNFLPNWIHSWTPSSMFHIILLPVSHDAYKSAWKNGMIIAVILFLSLIINGFGEMLIQWWSSLNKEMKF